jgi:hypothetical protein
LLAVGEKTPFTIRSWPDLNSGCHAHCFARETSGDRVVTTESARACG